jgi:hypothetical protein
VKNGTHAADAQFVSKVNHLLFLPLGLAGYPTRNDVCNTGRDHNQHKPFISPSFIKELILVYVVRLFFVAVKLGDNAVF